MPHMPGNPDDSIFGSPMSAQVLDFTHEHLVLYGLEANTRDDKLPHLTYNLIISANASFP